MKNYQKSWRDYQNAPKTIRELLAEYLPFLIFVLIGLVSTFLPWN